VKAWRRLQALGAVAVKSSVYVLPAGEQAQEDFEWLLREIVGDGGEGLICAARLVDGLSDAGSELFLTPRERPITTVWHRRHVPWTRRYSQAQLAAARREQRPRNVG
jgi:hypothetical protein